MTDKNRNVTSIRLSEKEKKMLAALSDQEDVKPAECIRMMIRGAFSDLPDRTQKKALK